MTLHQPGLSQLPDDYEFIQQTDERDFKVIQHEAPELLRKILDGLNAKIDRLEKTALTLKICIRHFERLSAE